MALANSFRIIDEGIAEIVRGLRPRANSGGESVSFSGQVSEWVRQSEDRMRRVFRESTQRVVAEMQTPVGAGGNMPIDTGFLRAGVVASTDAPTPIDPKARPQKGQSYVYNGGNVTLVIAGAELGQTVWVTYTAAYAAHQEYGTSKMAGRGFVRLAAQRWPSIVDEVCSEAFSRAGQG